MTDFLVRVAQRTRDNKCFVQACDGAPTWQGTYQGAGVLVCNNCLWRVPFHKRTPLNRSH